MKRITFTCETVTPMFLSGADGFSPELRPPSIKGAMRFWWRAMNGGLPTKDQDWKYTNLKHSEEEFFGGTGGYEVDKKKIQGSRSTFNIRITNPDLKIDKAANLLTKKVGLKYFFYLLDEKGPQLHREAILPTTTFDVIISAKEDEILRKAVACFWLVTYLGAIGSRARRGAGSFIVNQVADPFELLKDSLNMIPKEPISTFLSSGLKKVKSLLTVDNNNKPLCDQYSTLQAGSFYVSQRSSKSWDEALNHIANLMLKTREGNKSKHKEERDFTQETLDQKAAFGLPISVRNEKSNVEFDKNENYNHRASPLYISVIKLKKVKEYYWTLIHLKGQFMPPDTKIIFKPDYEWSSEDSVLIEQFVEKVKKNSQAISF